VRPTAFSTTVLATDAEEVAAVARFYEQCFDFEVRLDLGWFVTLFHGERPYELGVLQRDHDVVPAGFRGRVSGTIIGLQVDDVDACAQRLHDAGAPVVQELRDEPWGQRHLYVTDPAGTLIDVVQPTAPDPEWLASMAAAADAGS
jgi:predicted enzyme related to lactoylglutathione lyase